MPNCDFLNKKPTYKNLLYNLSSLHQLRNVRGQSLIEYLLIVALIAVTTIGMLKAVGTNINVHFANIAKALGGDAANQLSPVKVQADQVQTRDLHDYMKGAASGPRK